MKESEKLSKKEIDYHRYWKEQYEKERKLRQEVENEIVLIKGITITNSPELRAANSEINDLKNKIAVALDIKDGFITLSGWKKTTNISAMDFINKIKNLGVSRIIYTDVNKDGTKKGPNLKDTVEISNKTNIPLVISGGVSSIEDIKKI